MKFKQCMLLTYLFFLGYFENQTRSARDIAGRNKSMHSGRKGKLCFNAIERRHYFMSQLYLGSSFSVLLFNRFRCAAENLYLLMAKHYYEKKNSLSI